MKRLLMLYILLGLCLICAANALAERRHNVGFRTHTVWEPEQNIRLDTAIWYPTRRSASELNYGDWIFRSARRAPLPQERFPLILLSHDTGGCRFSLHPLAIALAGKGFIVAAPTHMQDNMNHIPQIFTLGQLESRTHELRTLIDALLRTEPFSRAIDAGHIGVVGVGPGATAALLLAGGRLDGSGWTHYCFKAGTRDPYCTPWVAPHMTLMASAINPLADWRDTRIKAAALIAPAYGMFCSARSLKGVAAPVLLLRADLDAINRAPNHADAIRAHLPMPPAYAVLEHSDNAALMGECAPALTQLLPDLCRTSPGIDRKETQRQMAEHVTAFMQTHLEEPNPNE